ncbi:hypothetical protein L917_04754 [Phytophthora nicotianae]|uniref:WLM domain-containing protein n=2 Tax=Phytophthora nicotianae TaxID=4792 RepID=V9FJP6_PHYNI|nr:hypothetical protein F443_05036 [Phytophthora nicotianae P1569]ETK91548.1 hypothetical protein L915_04908 [Phytophthora nicotianae]ETL98115.1 hypothetical protein L917_04754 [Phytophthora nicotianae]ETM51317.1 hypothetical protein L914_04858 [Phytophthora nicotianae]
MSDDVVRHHRGQGAGAAAAARAGPAPPGAFGRGRVTDPDSQTLPRSATARVFPERWRSAGHEREPRRQNLRPLPKRTPESFYPYEALLETLLHELTHMVHGPHNEAFYKYLDELKHEMEMLMVRGLVGEEGVRFAAAGTGQRLGGDNISVPIRVAAVLAAKRREQYNSLLGGETSRRLGSLSAASNEIFNPQALRRKILEAAERRRRDNEHCRNVLHPGASHEVLGIESSDDDEDSTSNGARQQAPDSSASDIIVLEEEEDAHETIANVPAVIDLLDDDGEEKHDDVPRRAGRKRKRGDTVDIIDLT